MKILEASEAVKQTIDVQLVQEEGNEYFKWVSTEGGDYHIWLQYIGGDHFTSVADVHNQFVPIYADKLILMDHLMLI